MKMPGSEPEPGKDLTTKLDGAFSARCALAARYPFSSAANRLHTAIHLLASLVHDIAGLVSQIIGAFLQVRTGFLTTHRSKKNTQSNTNTDSCQKAFHLKSLLRKMHTALVKDACDGAGFAERKQQLWNLRRYCCGTEAHEGVQKSALREP
jgi:hypothetical protein